MIVITAPASNIGRQVVDHILKSGEPVRVVARDPSRLSPEVRDRVEIVEGSHSDASVVAEAFAGADAVFWLVSADSHMESLAAAFLDFTRPVAELFKRGSVKRVVGISALGRGTVVAGRAGLVTGSLAMDDMIAATGVNYRALTMPSFMDNTLRQVELIKTQGIFTSPLDGDRKVPICATRDIAAIAARLLLDASWSGHGEVPVLGPADLSSNDLTRIMSDVLQRPIRVQQVPFEAYRARFIGFGASEAYAQALLDMASAKNEGLDNGVVRTPELSTPTSFHQWCEDTLKPAVLGRA